MLRGALSSELAAERRRDGEDYVSAAFYFNRYIIRKQMSQNLLIQCIYELIQCMYICIVIYELIQCVYIYMSAVEI